MKKIKNALISVYYKDGLDEIIKTLHQNEVTIYSTGGTYQFIVDLGIPCEKVEDLTTYPEILGGRVKTLHPAVFGGLLAVSSNPTHQTEMDTHKLPFFELMICNLYPFEEYLKNMAPHDELIEKIDIGGVSLIRAAAKNYKEVACVSRPEDYSFLLNVIQQNNGTTSIEDRKTLATHAFRTIANYDSQIANYFEGKIQKELRYGENPHQKGIFEGNFDQYFTQLNGKEISYNNILDLDAAIKIISEFEETTFAIIKHNNTCGLASRNTVTEAYNAAFECDSKSAFGGVLASNKKIDKAAAEAMNSLFFELIVAPAYDEDALEILKSKKNRMILIQKEKINYATKVKSALGGHLIQDEDKSIENNKSWTVATDAQPTASQISDLEFGIKAMKHLKSNAIALVKNQQLIGMGCGMVSRVDALHHAIAKAKEFELSLEGAVMCSDAFFPFPDCVAIAKNEGIVSVAQPGGSIKDQDSIDFCNQNELSMVMTGIRHFNH
jgi:phosphoribosylaminoimidazolecarboxamide formyltransferase/IMP cyclohydrolase